MSASTDTVSFWLENAARHPLLNKGQEVQLSRDIHAWLDAENPSPQVARRGKRAKDKLFNCNLRLVVAVAKKYQGRINGRAGIDFADILQEGCIGLGRACEKFDYERGFAFSTYSYWWIRQSIGRYVEVNQSVIKVSNGGSQIANRWRYRPEGMTIEEFAEKEKSSVKRCLEYIENVRRAEVCSLDAKLKSDESGSSLLDIQSDHDSDLEESDWIEAVEDLKEIDEIKDALALVDLSLQTKITGMAELLECTPPAAKKKLEDAKSIIREHAPLHIRKRICGKEQNLPVKMEPLIPLPEPSPARELALVGCNSKTELMPEAISAPSSNGHYQVDSDALERLVDEVQAEPAVKATRKRRSREEVAAEKASSAVALKINGMEWEGAPADIAAVMKALND